MMPQTTVDLPDHLLDDLKRTARDQGRSEEEIIREGIRLVVSRPMPRIPLFDSREIATSEDLSDLSERVDESLVGFGER